MLRDGFVDNGWQRCVSDPCIYILRQQALCSPYGTRLCVRRRTHGLAFPHGSGEKIYPNPLGSLQYAALCTRLDVSTVPSILGSAQAKPNEDHLQALKKVVRYFKGTINMRLAFRGVGGDHSLHLPCFADGD
jgi:hypothetical protein